MRWLINSIAAGLVSFAAPRIAIAAGIPLDKWLVQLGHWLGASIDSDIAIWVVTFVIGIALFGLEEWKHPAQRAWALAARSLWGTGHRDLIDMKEAATTAYEETRGTEVAEVAERLNADDVLGYYAHALFNGNTTVYGNHPPSRKLEPIPNEEYGRCGFTDDCNALHRHGVDQNLYVNLKISRADVERRIAEMKGLAVDPETARKWDKQRDWKRQPWARPVLVTAIFAVTLIVITFGTTVQTNNVDTSDASTDACTGNIRTVNEGQVRVANFEDHWALSKTIRLEGLSKDIIGVRFEARSKPGADLKVFTVVRPGGIPSPLDSYGQLDPEGIYNYVHKPEHELRIVIVAKKPELVEVTQKFKCETKGSVSE